ncbi:FecCD family ABC transporter permease [Paenibacillus endoradicis]|uniref:FecCD family ABC transporter permease n=1 Tax=Paenibacillus endoradicis TaxID=2972487 RepID=UPI002158CE00|nr:iron ABC transporter permease [Paenibacillus endoradicis]MCR8656371.1 iron ABC transporter permease [Paenibacillus endoradicis]
MNKKLIGYGGAAMLLLFITIITAISLGSSGISLADVWGILWHSLPFNDDAQLYYSKGEIAIVTQVRLSRVLLATFVGACLALAGVGFQGVLRNPLADPYTLGVASGSSVGAAFIILMGYQMLIGLWTIPLVAFGTGIATLFGVIALAKSQGSMQIQTLVLAGVIIQSFLGSFVSLMVSMSNGVVNEILFWIMGSISMKSWEHVYMLFPFVIITLPILMYYGQILNLLALGEREAAYMGVNVERSKIIVLIVCTLLTAAAVSVSGVIGFVGLVVPHIIRLIVGPDYRILIPLSAIGGGIYMIMADTIARLALSPKELPLGVITALIGAPIFSYLLTKKNRKEGGVQPL